MEFPWQFVINQDSKESGAGGSGNFTTIDNKFGIIYSSGQKFCCTSGQKRQLLITQLLIS